MIEVARNQHAQTTIESVDDYLVSQRLQEMSGFFRKMNAQYIYKIKNSLKDPLLSRDEDYI